MCFDRKYSSYPIFVNIGSTCQFGRSINLVLFLLGIRQSPPFCLSNTPGKHIVVIKIQMFSVPTGNLQIDRPGVVPVQRHDLTGSLVAHYPVYSAFPDRPK